MSQDSDQVSVVVSSREFLRLSDFKRFSDGSGYSAMLNLSAGHFSCHHYTLYFDRLEEFIERLSGTFDKLQGGVELGHWHEPDKIRFDFTSRGHFTISGTLGTANPDASWLHFALSADQTLLHPFIKQLHQVSRTLHAI